MVRRTAQIYTYGKDDQCQELMKYLEEADIKLDIRDIEKTPLTEYELRKLVGYCNINHFLNPLSKSYDKNDLGEKNKDRDTIIALMLKDYTLLRRPLVRTNRLTTIGCDKKILDSVMRLNSEPVNQQDIGNRGGGGMSRGGTPRHSGGGGSSRSSGGRQSRSPRPSNSGRGGGGGRSSRGSYSHR